MAFKNKSFSDTLIYMLWEKWYMSVWYSVKKGNIEGLGPNFPHFYILFFASKGRRTNRALKDTAPQKASPCLHLLQQPPLKSASPLSSGKQGVFLGLLCAFTITRRGTRLESFPGTCFPLWERQPPGRVVQAGTEYVSAQIILMQATFCPFQFTEPQTKQHLQNKKNFSG